MYSVLAKKNVSPFSPREQSGSKVGVDFPYVQELSENGKRDPRITRINKNQTSLRVIQELLMYSRFLWIVRPKGIAPTKLRYHIFIFIGISQG